MVLASGGERTFPLRKSAAQPCAWLAVRGRVVAPEVFVDSRAQPLIRCGFLYLLKQHAANAGRMPQLGHASRPACSRIHAQ